MKKTILLILLLLTNIAIAEIEYTKVFEGEVTENEEVTIDGKTFHTVVFREDFETAERAKITWPNGVSNIMSIGDCEIEGSYQICLQDLVKGGDDEFDIENQRYPFSPKLLVEKKEASIVIERNFQKTEFIVSQEIDVETIITNEGSEIVEVSFQDEFPDEIRVISCDGCTKDGQKVTWSGFVNLKDGKTITYTIEGKEPIVFDSVAKVTYGGEEKTDAQEIKVNSPPLKVQKTIPSGIDLDEKTTIEITLTNEQDDYNISQVNYRLYLPQGADEVDGRSSFSYTNGYWLYKGNVGGQENLSLELVMKKIGEFEIKEELTYKIEENTYTQESTQEFTVTTQEPVLSLGTQSGKKKVTFPIRIHNPNTRHTFKGLTVKVDTNLPVKTSQAVIDQLLPGQSITPLELSFNLPEQEEEIEIILTYSTIFGQQLKEKKVIAVGGSKEMQSEEQIEEQVIAKNDDKREGNRSNNATGVALTKEEFSPDMNLVWFGLGAVGILIIPLLIMLLMKRRRKYSLENRLEKEWHEKQQ
jgi:hypothetical protein